MLHGVVATVAWNAKHGYMTKDVNKAFLIFSLTTHILHEYNFKVFALYLCVFLLFSFILFKIDRKIDIEFSCSCCQIIVFCSIILSIKEREYKANEGTEEKWELKGKERKK